MLTAAQDVGATVVGESFHRFSPQGVTGILAIAESHISIHTWPEYAYAAADIFSCGSSFHPREAAARLVDQLESRDPQIKEIQRGLMTLPVAN
jgi:S-adenosylmethionine decarboxylase proenzyme